MWIEAPVDLTALPREPGVYRMLDGGGKVLYVGKARNLRKRVSSYFQRRPDSGRTLAMVVQIRDIAFTVTPSEAEALVLEHNLIKQLKPRYNVLLKDAKSYPYILLTREPFPKLRIYRGKRSEPGDYFGPFADARAVHATLHLMQKVFRLRDCEDAVFANRSRPCLQHQIGRCSAPCCELATKEEYAGQVKDAAAFLKGRDSELMGEWQQQMLQAAVDLHFERAAQFRDRIRMLRTIFAAGDAADLPPDADAIVVHRTASGVAVTIGVRRAGRDLGSHTVRVAQAEEAGDGEIVQSLLVERYRQDQAPREILLDLPEAELAELQELLRLLGGARSEVRQPRRGHRLLWLRQIERAGSQSVAARSHADQQPAFEALAELLGLPETPNLIAAVDNAHLGGKQTVAAIVFAGWEGAKKELYRRYRLDEVAAGDDYDAMRAVLTRFFRAIAEESIPQPDLMLIDGGRGQLAVAIETANEAGLTDLRLLAVAKGESRKVGEETLWPGWGAGEPLKPGRHAPALLLVARVRDEAHRFAGEYLKKRQKSRLLTSSLDTIPGIGPAKRTALLKHFGGIEGVKQASREQLAQVSGVTAALAERIFAELHK